MGLFGNSVEILDDELFGRIKKILKEAKPQEKVYLVTPYIHFDEKIREAIGEAVSRHVEVILLVRKGADRTKEDIAFLTDSKINVYELEWLHGKIYWSKDGVLITSMNLYDSSDRKGKEIGVWLEDKKYVEKVRETIDKWIGYAVPLPPSALMATQQPAVLRVAKGERLMQKQPRPISTATKAVGFCIRCKKQKTFNPDFPLCDDCYKEWAQYKNKDYREKFCHRCGEPTQTSMAHPLCKSCFQRLI